MDIAETIYFVGLLFGFRYHVGAFLGHMRKEFSYIDGVDYIMGMFFGLVTMWLWPLTFGGRLVYIGIVKSGVATDSVGEMLFPAPKAIETRAQKQKRKAREQSDLHESQMRAERVRTHQARKRTNDLEAEAGLPLTVWEN